MLRKTLVMSAALMFATAVSGQAQDMTYPKTASIMRVSIVS